MYTENSLKLTNKALLAMLSAASAKAEEIGQPQCIVIVDSSGEILGSLRMVGSKFLSLKSARAKARTAASIGAPSDAIPEAVGLSIAAATNGEVTRLAGGLPVIIDGHLVGGIGIGSGSPDQDKAVAEAGLCSIGAELG